MIIDIFFAVAVVLGFYLGFEKGIVHAVFSFFGWFIGACVAVRWCHNVSISLYGLTNSHSRLIPLLAFLLIFITVIILVNLLANLLISTFKAVGLGFVNQLAGGLLWCFVFTFVLSILLWFGNELHWIDKETKATSYVYSYIAPIAPATIHIIGGVLPWFKNAFEHLQTFISPDTVSE